MKHTRTWTAVGIRSVCVAPIAQAQRSYTRVAQCMRAMRGIKRVNRKRQILSPMARSGNLIAESNEASTSYIQKLRDAAADLFRIEQARQLEELPPVPCESATYEVSFDETEIKVSIPIKLPDIGRTASHTKHTHTEVSTFMMHGTLDWHIQEHDHDCYSRNQRYGQTDTWIFPLQSALIS